MSISVMRRAMELAPWIKLFGGVRLVRKAIRKNLVAVSGDASWVSDSVVDGYTVGAARDLDGTLKAVIAMARAREHERLQRAVQVDRKSTRLNSSHGYISYAVFCLKKKTKEQ